MAEHQAAGTVRQAVHLVRPPKPEDVARVAAEYEGFRAALAVRAAPGWNPLDAYAAEVLEGRLPAGKYHRLACARHVRDRGRERSSGFPYWLDLDAVARFVAFARRLKHYKGQWGSGGGAPLELEPQQVFRLGSMVGWRHVSTGFRRYRRAWHEIPRKNGKSLEAALVALYLTFYDGEPGAEGYCAATKKDQARIVWGDAQQLVERSILRCDIRSFARNLHDPITLSKLEPLGSDYDSTDGLNPHVIIQDEFHAYKDRGQIDVLETATGARRQPLDMRITTAGDDLVSPGGDEHTYATQILEELAPDESYFAFIAHMDVGDDWRDPKTWEKANPNYGVSVGYEDLHALCRKAIAMPSAAPSFQQKRLNVWVNASAPWLSLEGWRRGQSTWSAAELRHEPCYAGVDLASKLDLAPLVLLFPPRGGRPTWRILRWVWTPEATLADRAHRDRAPYVQWRDQGILRTTPGETIDHQAIRRMLVALRAEYDLEAIGFDPWHADTLISQLTTEDGFRREQVLAVPQTYQGMSSATAQFEALVLAGLVDAGGCPLMAWCASNAVVQRDGKDNMYPVKRKSRGRIDPIMAAIIALTLALRQSAKEPQYQILVF